MTRFKRSWAAPIAQSQNIPKTLRTVRTQGSKNRMFSKTMTIAMVVMIPSMASPWRVVNCDCDFTATVSSSWPALRCLPLGQGLLHQVSPVALQLQSFCLGAGSSLFLRMVRVVQRLLSVHLVRQGGLCTSAASPRPLSRRGLCVHHRSVADYAKEKSNCQR